METSWKGSEGQWAPRAFERLNAALDCRLTLLVAPARCGKTTLLHSWANACKWPVAWVTLTPEDNVPARFLSDLLAALEAIGLPSGGLDPGLVAEASLADALVEVLNVLVEWPDDWVLILDSYHVIASDEIHEAARFLLDYLPPQMHIVIASRTEPPLQLPRLRVRRQLYQVSLEDCAPG